MSSVIFEFSGRSYVAGMFWEVSHKSKIRTITDIGLKAGLSVTARNGQYLLGFVENIEPMESIGSYSIAAELYRIIDNDNWSGIFQVSDDRYVYIAVKEGVIHNTSDVVSDDLDELLRFVKDDISKWKPKLVFTPGKILKGSREIILHTALLNDFSNKSLVKNMSDDWMYKLFIVLMFTLISIGGYHYYTKLTTEAEQEHDNAVAKEASETKNLLRIISGRH